jgi:hypothetical protein
LACNPEKPFGLENSMKTLILGAALLLALPAAATAQTATPAPLLPQPLVVMRAPNLYGISAFDQSDVERERLRRDGAGTPTERRERAERLAALVNSGQCQAAHDAALQERDRVMAARIDQVCRPATAADSAS